VNYSIRTSKGYGGSPRLLASFKDGRYVSVGGPVMYRDKRIYSIHYLNKALKKSARTRGYSPGEAMAKTKYADSVIEMRRIYNSLVTGKLWFLDEDMIEAYRELVHQFFSVE